MLRAQTLIPNVGYRMEMNKQRGPGSTSWLLFASPVISVVSMICHQMYVTSHWHTPASKGSFLVRCSLLLPIDIWKLVGVVLAILALVFAFARSDAHAGILLRILALVLAVFACLNSLVIT